MPTSTKRPAHGAWTLKAAASATAKTVPGRAQGAAMSVSSGALQRPLRRTASEAAREPEQDRERGRGRRHPERVDDRAQPLGLREERAVVAEVEHGRQRLGRPGVAGHERDEDERGVGQEQQDGERPAGGRRGPLAARELPAARRDAPRRRPRPRDAARPCAGAPEPASPIAASATVSTIAIALSPFSFDATICVVMTRKLPPKM